MKDKLITRSQEIVSSNRQFLAHRSRPGVSGVGSFFWPWSVGVVQLLAYSSVPGHKNHDLGPASVFLSISLVASGLIHVVNWPNPGYSFYLPVSMSWNTPVVVVSWST